MNNNNNNNENNKNRDPELENLQKVDIFLQQLPYFDKIKTNGFATYEEIKRNILLTITLNEIRPGLIHWSNRLIVFIHEFGLFFSKDEHVQLIKLYLKLIYASDLDLPTVEVGLNVLYELLKKTDKLTRNDLIIEWRPVYNLYMRIHNIDDYSAELVPENMEQNSLANFIRYARVYFEIDSTKEMLAEWRISMCPFDSAINDSFEKFKLFLPTILYEHETEFGYKLWLDEFLKFWTTFSTRNFWESNIIDLFARVANDTIGEFDWTPYIPYIFSNTLRGFGLPFAIKDSITISNTAGSSFSNFTQAFVYTSDDISNLATWMIAMISSGQSMKTRNTCMEHIKRLFQALRSFYYPSNSGNWSSNLFLFLKSMPSMLIKRIKREKRDQNKWFFKKINEINLISDQDKDCFVDALKDVVFTAIFSKSNHNDARKAFQCLTFLNGDKMLPPLINKLYESLESVTEPFRYTSILSCLTLVAREMARLETTRLDIIPLISAVLPGLDPNDSNKCILTLQLLSNIFSSIIIMDCSKAANYRSDLKENETQLCYETPKFEDFLHEFFKRIFYIVEYLASDTSADCSASAAAASNQFSINGRNKNAQENIYQAHMMQTLKIIIRQSSKQYLKLILNKMRNYLNSNIYNPRSGRILASVCACLVGSAIDSQSFEIFFTYCYDNLSKIKDNKTFEQLAHDERGDIEVIWNLQLFSELMKANGPVLLKHMDKITLLFSWFKYSINKEIIGFMSSAYRYLIMSLSGIYPIEYCSVNYDICFDDVNEQEFFKSRMPIRDWGCTADVYKLNIKYHIPTVEELEFCIKFTNTHIQSSYKFLTENLINSSSLMSTTLREECSRELHYFNNIIYGASRLLKRPSSKFATEHIESCTQIGTQDDVDKGLGFERANLFDSTHEYSKLSQESKNILLNLRNDIIDFNIKLAEHLMNRNSNETSLLMTIPYILSTASVVYGFFVNDFEKFWKNHHTNKSTMQNKLLGKKSSIREELIQRIMLQYQFRTFYVYTRLSTVDLKIIDLMFKLSTDSVYAVVRKEAQTRLFSLLSHYPYSSQIMVPKIVGLLKRCCRETPESERLTHEQLKGCLYLLKGNNLQDSLMVKQNWSILAEIWPALFRCQHFEKPSVQALLDKIYFNANKDHDSFDNRIRLSDDLVNFVYQISPELETKYKTNEKLRLEYYNRKYNTENTLISTLMSKLIQITYESNLLWKNQATSLGSILFLLNSCKLEKRLLTDECVRLFVDSLVHENINVRRIALDGMVVILKMVKYRKEQKLFNINEVVQANGGEISINICNPGYRNDNQWHAYDSNFLNNITSQSQWEQTKFLDKSYWGYYCWPKQILLNSTKRRIFSSSMTTTNLDEYELALRPIVERFKNDPQFFDKFVKLSTIEESKGNEKFDKKKFMLFKSLFRNFGTSSIIQNLFDHLNKLVNDKQQQTQECSHKLAAEIISGLMRGSKYWPYPDLQELWSKLKVIFDQVIDNLTSENLKLYYNCFSTAFEDQDPRRMTFYINYFVDLTLKMFDNSNDNNKYTSFQQTSCLHILISFGQFEWRIQSFWHKLMSLFMKQMDHTYKTIREKIGTCMSLCLNNEIDYTTSLAGKAIKPVGGGDSKENLNKFITYIENKLNQSIELFDYVNEDVIDENNSAAAATGNNSMQVENDSQKLAAVNFLQATFAWLGNFFSKSYQPINKETIRLIAKLCSIDKIAAQDVLVKAMLPLIRSVFSMWMLDQPTSRLFLDELKLALKFKSWHSRLASIQMIQNYGLFNLFLLNDDLKGEIKQLVVDSLCEDQLEVRLLAGLALTGFIHSNLIQVDDDLIQRLKQLSKIKARSKEKETGKIIINMPNLIKRHGGILGICSIVNSCPYDVPAYLPDLVTYLCQFTNDPVPVQTSVKKCLSEFRRTHHDNWQEHKLSFSEHQLSTLADILISPNYYA